MEGNGDSQAIGTAGQALGMQEACTPMLLLVAGTGLFLAWLGPWAWDHTHQRGQ